MGHETNVEHVMMVMYMVVPMVFTMFMGTVFSGMMMLFVHMYMKLLYLWNAPLYSEKPPLFTHWTKKYGILFL